MRLSRVHDWPIVTWVLDSDAARSDDADRLPVLQVHQADLQGLRASCLGALSIVVESGVLYSVTPSFLHKSSSVNSGAIFAAGPGPISMRVPLPSHNNTIRKNNPKAQQKKDGFVRAESRVVDVVQKQPVNQNCTLKQEARTAETKPATWNQSLRLASRSRPSAYP
ncbi:hypothetical protein EDB85DRAFT_2147721 [Lactarius pseudohatsudake]|nr:hypothetical protein EDB85DRAFT_2147721 [Lactarius pseudohatsudake]